MLFCVIRLITKRKGVVVILILKIKTYGKSSKKLKENLREPLKGFYK